MSERRQARKSAVRNPRPLYNPARLFGKARNRVEVVLRTTVGEINLAIPFRRGEDAEKCIAVLLESEACAGASLFIGGSFMGGHDGAGS